MLYDKDMSLAEMERKVAAGYVCACSGRINVAWGGAFGYQGYVLRCGKDPTHNTITRYPKNSAYRRQIEEALRMNSEVLARLTQKQMEARVDMWQWPHVLTKEEKDRVVSKSRLLGLDPALGELSLYHGEPHVTIAGRLRKAQETGCFGGVNSRPATAAEKKARGYGEKDHAIIAQVWRTGAAHPFEGWGVVTQREVERNRAATKDKEDPEDELPVVKDPPQHAEKRAIARSLKLAFHIPLPNAEDIGADDEQPPSADPATPTATLPRTPSIADGVVEDFRDLRRVQNDIDEDWLRETLATLGERDPKWSEPSLVEYLSKKYHVIGSSVSEIMRNMRPAMASSLAAGLQQAVDNPE